MSKHRRALEAAIAVFGEGLDASAWEEAFASADPGDTNRVLSVAGGYSTLINNYVELLKAGARLAGLVRERRPNAERCFEVIRDDGGLTADQAETLTQLYGMEGRLEHASPDVQADEVREAVLRLRSELPKLVEQAVTWLGRHGIEVG